MRLRRWRAEFVAGVAEGRGTTSRFWVGRGFYVGYGGCWRADGFLLRRNDEGGAGVTGGGVAEGMVYGMQSDLVGLSCRPVIPPLDTF